MEETDNKDNGCCRDKHKFLKNDTDQKTTGSAFQLIKLIALAIPASFVEIPYNVFTSIAEVNPASNAPPPGRSVAVYIRNCVFLI